MSYNLISEHREATGSAKVSIQRKFVRLGRLAGSVSLFIPPMNAPIVQLYESTNFDWEFTGICGKVTVAQVKEYSFIQIHDLVCIRIYQQES